MYRIFTLLALFCMLAGVPVYAQTNKSVDIKKAASLVQQNAAALGLKEGSIENLRVSYAYYDYLANATMIYVIQTFNGVDVSNAEGVLAFRDDKLFMANPSRVLGLENTMKTKSVKPTISALTAVYNAAKDLGVTFTTPMVAALKQSADNMEFEFADGGVALNNIKARLVWVVDDVNQDAKLSWYVRFPVKEGSADWVMHVDASNGSVISKINNTRYETLEDVKKAPRTIVYEAPELTASADIPAAPAAISKGTYKLVTLSSPFKGAVTTIVDPWNQNVNANASTLKWNNDGSVDYNITRGNNVFVYDDLDSNDVAGPNSSPVSTKSLPEVEFVPNPDFDGDPIEDFQTRNFGLTNLFYWGNYMHDLVYAYGMDEVNRNFQASNQGRGGAQNDYVVIEGFDGKSSGDDATAFNANFSTPADGGKGRMQVGLFGTPIFGTLEWVASPALAAENDGFMRTAENAFDADNKLSQVGSKSGDVVYYTDEDNTGHWACRPGNNGSNLVGKIAFINRGGKGLERCPFVTKVINAQNAGAIGVIVANDYVGSDTLATMIGTGPEQSTITIPAFFITWVDGEKVRAELDANTPCFANLNYIPKRDGNLDNSIHTHEYGHGISNRQMGTNATCLLGGEQPGEGWSDYYALMSTTNWATATATDGAKARSIGAYAFGFPSEEYSTIRSYFYSTDLSIDPWTYDSLQTPSIAENDFFDNIDNGILGGCDYPKSTKLQTRIAMNYLVGEIWASTLWDMTWDLIQVKGIAPSLFDNTDKEAAGNIISMNLVMKGMNLTKCYGQLNQNPGLIDCRNGLLKADTLLYGGRYSAIIWNAFARRGMGYSANQGASNCKIKDLVAAYDLPPLPVVWGKFTAVKQGKTALLKWSTKQEINTDKFIVERSTDGGRTYAAIGTVKAKGNSGIESFYQTDDLNPAIAKNSYRIKQVDLDGKSTYSTVESLDFASLKPVIKLLPNPVVGNTLTIQIDGNTENLSVQLISTAGQQLGSYIMTGATLPVDVSRLSSGVYNLVIKGEGFTANYKVVVNK